MKDALKDLWFYFLGFSIFMIAAPIVAWSFPYHDPHHKAMNGIASLCVFMSLIFLDHGRGPCWTQPRITGRKGTSINSFDEPARSSFF